MVDFNISSLEEALDITSANNVTPVAGGTDLMVRFKSLSKNEATVENPLMIAHLPELKGIFKNKRALVIGACTTLSEIINSDKIPEILKNALSEIGSPGIRNQGTLGGNICNASPAGDSLPLLYLFKAKLVLVSKESERIVPIEEFIIGPGRTIRKSSEILTQIIIENEYFSDKYSYIFEKIGNRKADAISKATFGIKVGIEHGVVIDIEAAFGAMGPKVTLLNSEIKELILGESFPLTNLDKIVLKDKLFNLLTPIDDQRSTAEYRKHVALNLLNFYLTTENNLRKIGKQ